MPIIVFERGSMRGKRLTLPASGIVRIGRDQTCQLKLLDTMVSRVHCILRGDKGVWTIEDAGSSNGTTVNGIVVPKATLAPGDLVRIGDSVFSFLATQDDPWVGKTLGGYRLQARVGRGGMGTVYRAHQISLEREVALKILSTSLARNPEFVARFMKEARAAARLNHPNVVQVYDAGSDENTHFIAMEYLPGGALEDVMLKRGPIPYREAVPIACDALKALAFAQAHGIVHRDIKPGNLLFAHDGKVKVCDLGIALDLRQPESQLEGTTAGSPAYMAPEQARGEVLDHRADLYALGATLYHAVAGVPPIDGANVKEILNKKVTQEAPPLRDRVPDVSPRLSQVVAKLLALYPKDRFVTALEAEEALNAALRAPAPAPAPRKSPAARAASYRKPLPAGQIAAVVAAIAILLVVVFLVVKNSGKPEREVAKERQKPAAVVEAPKPAIAPDPLVAAREKQRAEELALAKAEEEAAQAAKDHAARIERMLSENDLVGAAAALDSFPASAKSTAVRAALREALLGKIKAELAAFTTRVTALCEEGRFDEARAEAENLRAKLPPSENARVEEILLIVARAQETRTAVTQTIELVTRDVMARMAALDFPAASKALNDFLKDQPNAEKLIVPLRAEVDAAAALWQQLTKVLEDNAKARKTLALALLPDPLDGTSEGRFRLTAITRDRMSVEETEGKRRKEVRSVFEVAPAALLALLGDANLKTPLGLLCLLRAGAEPASALLLASDLPAETRAANEKRVAAFAAVWLNARYEALKAFREELAVETKSVTPDTWAFTAREAARLLSAWSNAHPDIAAGLKAWYVADRAKFLASGPLDNFFSAQSVKTPRPGFVQLAYDFSSEAQLQDFVPVGGATTSGRNDPTKGPAEKADAEEEKPALRWLPAKKALELTGEVRFLHDDPFEETIVVTGKVATCFPESPNVNIAFFTSPKDRVTFTMGQFDGGAWWRRRGQPLRPEYVVFGMGYYIPLELNNNPGAAGGGQPSLAPTTDLDRVFRAGGRGGGGVRGGVGGARVPGGVPSGGGAPGGASGGGIDDFLRGVRALGPVYIREPSYVILGGEHGQHLGYSPEQLLWSQGASGKVTAPFVFQVGVSKGAIQWVVKGKPIPYTKTPDIARLGDTLSTQGSFSLFTVGSTVVYAGVEVQAKLRAEWVAKEAERLAQEELARILSGKDVAKTPNGDGAPKTVSKQP